LWFLPKEMEHEWYEGAAAYSIVIDGKAYQRDIIGVYIDKT